MRKASIMTYICVHSVFNTQIAVISNFNDCQNYDQVLATVLKSNRLVLESDTKTCTQAGFLEETLKKSMYKI